MRVSREVKEKLKLMGFSDSAILGVSAVEDAGYIPNSARGAGESRLSRPLGRFNFRKIEAVGEIRKSMELRRRRSEPSGQ